MEGSAWLDPKGRVIVFINPEPTEDTAEVEVYAIPGHWDDDDIDRYIGDRCSNFDRAAVTAVKEVEA